MYDKTGHRRPPGDVVVHGLYGNVIYSEKSFFTNDLQSHPASIGVPHGHPKLTSFLGVPLVLDGKMMGMIGVANREGGYSSEQQVDLEAITPAVVQALHRKKAEIEHKQTRVRMNADLDALTRMHELSTKLLVTDDTQPLLDEIVYSAVVIVGAKFGTLQLLEDDSLRIVSHYGHLQPFLDFFASAENVASVCGEAMQRWERVIITDVETSPLFVGTSSLDVMRKAGVRAVQSTPMISRAGELFGILTTQWDVPYSPNEHDLWRIDLLARQAADMIELVKKGKELHESEERLRLLSDNLPDSALYQYVHELDGSVRFLYCSAGIEKLNGVSVQDVLQDPGTLHRQMSPKYFEQLAENEARSAHELSDFDMDVPMQLPNGQVRWMRLHARPRRLPDGRTIWDGVQIDITERKKIESSLRESEHIYRAIGESIDYGVWVCDPNGRNIYASPSFLKMVGITQQQCSDLGWGDTLHPDDAEKTIAMWQACVKNEGNWDIKHRFRGVDGQWHNVLARGVPVRDDAGKIMCWAGINLDINDIVTAEAALRESEERLLMIQKSSGIGSWEQDIGGGPSIWSPEEYALLGLDPATCFPSHKAWKSTVFPEDLERIEANIRKAIATKSTLDFDYRVVLPDGSIRWLVARGGIGINSAGQPVLRGINVDITERKLREHQLYNTNQRLESLLNALPVGVSFSNDVTCKNITGNPALLAQFDARLDDNISASAPDDSALGRQVRFFLDGRQIGDRELPMQRAIAENRTIPPMELEVEMPSGRRWFTEASGAPIYDMENAVIGGVAITIDITKRKKVEQELLESEAQSRVSKAILAERQQLFDILETLPIMVCLLTPDYHVAFSNRSFREKFGESGGRCCYDFCFGCKKPCEFCESYKVLETGQPHFWEVHGPDGSIIEAYDFPFTDVDGSPMILEMDIDITERKRMESELQEIVLEKSLILDNINASIAFHDIDNCFMWANKFYLDSIGKHTSELKGRRCYDCWGLDRLCVNCPVIEAIRTGQPQEGEMTPENQPHWPPDQGSWLVRAAPVKNAKGKIIGAIEVAHNITESKLSEEKLKLLYIYNRSLIEASLDPLVTIGYDGKISDVNSAAEFATGYSRDELFDTDFTNYFTEPEKAKEVYQEVFKKGQVSDYALEIKHRDGSITPVLYNASVYHDESGEVLGIFAAARDITERKKVEKMLKLKIGELQRSNEELEQFAYISSHDMQEPLRMITSYLQLLQKRYQGNLDDKADKYIHFAVDGASHMQNLINDLLEYSRATTSTKESELIDCEAILNKVISNLELFINENNATVSRGSLPKVMANSTQLIQVFQNLIVNGIKFHGEETPKIHVAAEKKASEWVFSVQDNGIGIDPQYSERIFEVFKRLHTREEYSGTGIGLAICKRIIERSGGCMWVESELGKGSTFYFTLPIKEISEM